MKRLIAMLLALVTVFSLSVTAFAEEAEDRTATADKDSEYKVSIDVNGEYISQLESDKIISVDVAWDSMDFEYYASQQGTWDPTTHTYTGDKDAKWNKTTSNITVSNHSNAQVTATLSYTPSVTSVTGSLSETSLTLESAAQDKYMGSNAGKAPSAKSTFTIGGTMEETSANALGTITVSVEEGDGIEWTVVDNYADLKTALSKGGNIKLGADITHIATSNSDYLAISKDFNLNLNGKKLTVAAFRINKGTASISNGTITTSDTKCYGINANGEKLTINNCTVNGANYWALYVNGCDVTLKNTTLNDGVYLNNGAKLSATENVTMDVKNYKISVKEESSATFGFDPTGKVSNGTITDNGDGTWTVS